MSASRSNYNKKYPATNPNALHFDIFHPDITTQHLKAGVDINVCSLSGFGTPLHVVIANEKGDRFVNILTELNDLKIKFNFTLQDGTGKTLLILAAKTRQAKLLKAILSFAHNHQSYIDMVDEDGRTALHYASMLGDYVSAALLLTAGADAEIQDGAGNVAFYYTQQSNREFNQDLIRHVLMSTEIDPNRHYRASFNSLAAFSGGSVSLLQNFMIKELGFIASLFKRADTKKLEELSNTSLQELLVCRKNKPAFFNYSKLLSSNEVNEEQNSLLKLFVPEVESEWKKITTGPDMTLLEYCLQGQREAAKLLLKHKKKYIIVSRDGYELSYNTSSKIIELVRPNDSIIPLIRARFFYDNADGAAILSDFNLGIVGAGFAKAIADMVSDYLSVSKDKCKLFCYAGKYEVEFQASNEYRASNIDRLMLREHTNVVPLDLPIFGQIQIYKINAHSLTDDNINQMTNLLREHTYWAAEVDNNYTKAAINNSELIVAFNRQLHIVGFVRFISNNHIAYVSDLVIHSCMRKQKIGTALMQEACRLIDQQRHVFSALISAKEGDGLAATARLYGDKCGFQEYATSHQHTIYFRYLRKTLEYTNKLFKSVVSSTPLSVYPSVCSNKLH